jgi:hypothetical protein
MDAKIAILNMRTEVMVFQGNVGRMRGAFASSMQPLLSSKTVEWATVEPTIN